MPTLDWIGKQAVVNHHRDVPYRLIHCENELSAGDPDAGNLLVQGDNLEALRALLPYYAGQVKCIYIDPPYNTGNEGWVYNDNVNSPEIREWLNKEVKKETEDLSRHDKWLCMMYPRLRLLRDFLREDGFISMSLDDNELHHAVMLMDSIFGEMNRIGIFAVVTANETSDSEKTKNNDFLLIYQKSEALDIAAPKKIQEARCTTGKEDQTQPIIKFPRGISVRGVKDGYYEQPRQKQDSKENLHVVEGNLIVEDGQLAEDVSLRARWSNPNDIKKFIEKFRTGSTDPIFNKFKKELLSFWFQGDKFQPRMQKLGFELPYTFISHLTSKGSLELSSIIGKGKFPYPKHTSLLQFLMRLIPEEDAIIMDSFAGSGTTGHAVLDLNRQDGGNRRFILVEMDEGISKDVTSERLRHVIGGYNKDGDPEKPVEGLGGGFRFCRLGTPLFDEYGDIAGDVTFPDLAAHIFFSETGAPIPKKATGALLGTYQDRAVYLLFDEANAQFPREAVGNVLTLTRLEDLPPIPEGFDGRRVIYAEGCTISESRLKAEGLIFKQIPYQVDGAR